MFLSARLRMVLLLQPMRLISDPDTNSFTAGLSLNAGLLPQVWGVLSEHSMMLSIYGEQLLSCRLLKLLRAEGASSLIRESRHYGFSIPLCSSTSPFCSRQLSAGEIAPTSLQQMMGDCSYFCMSVLGAADEWSLLATIMTAMTIMHTSSIIFTKECSSCGYSHLKNESDYGCGSIWSVSTIGSLRVKGRSSSKHSSWSQVQVVVYSTPRNCWHRQQYRLECSTFQRRILTYCSRLVTYSLCMSLERCAAYLFFYF